MDLEESGSRLSGGSVGRLSRYGRDSGVGRGLGVTLGVAVGVAGSTAVFFLPESSSFNSSVIFLATALLMVSANDGDAVELG